VALSLHFYSRPLAKFDEQGIIEVVGINALRMFQYGHEAQMPSFLFLIS
jgi:hypothetical protein